jgi:hypothetical protein
MDARESIEQAKADLTRLKDELKVKLHLAKKDAELAWKELEPRFGQLEKKLDDAGKVLESGAEKARLQATLGLNEVKSAWPGFEKAIEQVVTDVKKGAEGVKGDIDTGRLKAHLAAMDAAIAKTDIKAAADKVAKDFEDAAKDVQKTFEGFAKRIFKS